MAPTSAAAGVPTVPAEVSCSWSRIHAAPRSAAAISPLARSVWAITPVLFAFGVAVGPLPVQAPEVGSCIDTNQLIASAIAAVDPAVRGAASSAWMANAVASVSAFDASSQPEVLV